ncbi:hypothetical protein [Burkholderia ubonensis]|uniref:hypothetical protein n=1 Tax=Burkholderia ubonensis TaxID=101571 RepID=UPI0012F922B1|nr:hypothetical protein [Burkholderia ubonensis]
MKAASTQYPQMTCRYDSTEWLDVLYTPNCDAPSGFAAASSNEGMPALFPGDDMSLPQSSPGVLGPGVDVLPALSARKTGGLFKRARNGVGVKLVGVVEIVESAKQNKVIDEVPIERRYRTCPTGGRFKFDHFEVRVVFSFRCLVGALDQRFSFALAKVLFVCFQRRECPEDRATNRASGRRNRGNSSSFHVFLSRIVGRKSCSMFSHFAAAAAQYDHREGA